MVTEMIQGYTLTLSADERETLLDVLQEVLKETSLELRRTASLAARKVVAHREALIESVLNKARQATSA
jgi:hypothetical protein